jgi:hypothetical protein
MNEIGTYTEIIEKGVAADGLIPLIPLAAMFLFLMGVLPIPVGWERGKVKWVMWCGTGMHAHVVYRTERGFQTLHPEDRNGE